MLVGSVSGTGSTVSSQFKSGYPPHANLVLGQIGSDSSVHLGEELREAAWVLPRSMVTSAITNWILAFLILISEFTITKVSRCQSR
jgi:hypothetical protein